MIAKLIGALLAGGTLVASDLPNPAVGECAIADVIITRSEPTFIDPDGPVTGIRIWQVCSYQVPTGIGSNVRAVDEQFVIEVDVDDAEMIVSAADELLGD